MSKQSIDRMLVATARTSNNLMLQLKGKGSNAIKTPSDSKIDLKHLVCWFFNYLITKTRMAETNAWCKNWL